MDIQTLLDNVRDNAQCQVHSAQGVPTVSTKHSLPADVLEFYRLCGGIDLFKEEDYPYNIVSPQEFVRANPVIIRNHWQEWEDDISADWYIIASDPERQYLTIDLNPQRLGNCYDSFIGNHAVPGSSPVIATSFTDFLHRLIQNLGQHPYWLKSGFDLGDAYDEQ